MDRHRQLMRSTSCVGCSLSSLEHNEFVESSPNRSFMDAVDALAVLRPKRSWPILTADLTGRCTSYENTAPKSSGLPTNAPTEVRKSLLVIRIDGDTTIPITDAGTQDSCSDRTCSSKDDLPILVENNPTKDSTMQDTCLDTDIAAVDDSSSQITPISAVPNDSHLLEGASACDSAREFRETISWNVSCVSTDASIQYSLRLSLYDDAKISYCCDSVKPSSSSNYYSKLLPYKDAKMSNCCDSFKPRSSSHYDAISDFEIMNLHCKKFDKHRRKDRPQRTKRKWKKVPNEMQMKLRTSLFPRTGIIINISNTDDAEENEIQQELELFQNALESCEQQASIDAEINETCTAPILNGQELSADFENKGNVETRPLCEQLEADMNKNCVDFKSSILVPVPIQKNKSRRDKNKTLPERKGELCRVKRKLDLDALQFPDCDNIENVTFYENKIPLRSCSALESFSWLAGKKLRAKKKWKETKAHIQIKTKYCRSLNNSVHGVTFYIHHRVMKLMSMKLEPRTYVSSLSLSQIDAAKGFVKEGTSCVAPRSNTRKTPVNHSAQNTSPFAIDAFNADGDLAAEVVNIMINLQHRDLLPEDYDLLLRLDDRVKPKTVDVAILTQLKTECVICDGDVLDVCAVCLDPYEVGHMKKYLPCQHYFHETCIDNWLSNSSMNCPLDGTPILPS